MKGTAREIGLELHFTHLNRRLGVGVVRDVAHDLACMWAERRLEGFHGIKVEVAHGTERRRRAGRGAAQALLYSGTLACRPELRQDHRDVPVKVVVHIERAIGTTWI